MQTQYLDDRSIAHARFLRSVGQSRTRVRLDTTDRLTEEQPELLVYRDIAALIDALTHVLTFAYVDARSIILNFGAVRVEGALVKTEWEMRSGQHIRRPNGWFLSTLKGGHEWDAETIKLHLDWLEQRELEAAEVSNNVTERRLAKERRAIRAANAATAGTAQAAAASETTRQPGRSSPVS